MKKKKEIEYQFIVKPLAVEDGGGFIVEFPDLQGCMSDGETIDEAIANGKEAAAGWIEACKKLGRKVPDPHKKSSYSGKVLLRIPKYLHEKLIEASEIENISLNSLIQTFVAEGLGRKSH